MASMQAAGRSGSSSTKSRKKCAALVAEQYRCIMEEVLPRLKKVGIFIHRIDELDKKESKRLEEYFEAQVFPILTPLAVDAGHPFPFLGNLRLNLMVVFKEASGIKVPQAYAFVEVPSILPRLVPVNAEMEGYHFILLEDLIREHIHRLFPGMEIKNIIAFRVTRNHDYDLHEDEVMDLLKSVEAEIRDRSDKIAVRLEIEPGAPKKVVNLLARQLGVEERFVYEINGPINIRDFLSLYELPVDASHKDPPFNPRIPQRFAADKDIFTIIREGDVLLHHPYDSFAVVMDFLNTAADDPDVLAIKQTLYRIGKDSPVIGALRRAAENGKQVTAVVELKARFDEEYNIDLSRQMEESGVNAVFGFVRWKTHCKATLVVRREGKQLAALRPRLERQLQHGDREDLHRHRPPHLPSRLRQRRLRALQRPHRVQLVDRRRPADGRNGGLDVPQIHDLSGDDPGDDASPHRSGDPEVNHENAGAYHREDERPRRHEDHPQTL